MIDHLTQPNCPSCTHTPHPNVRCTEMVATGEKRAPFPGWQATETYQECGCLVVAIPRKEKL